MYENRENITTMGNLVVKKAAKNGDKPAIMFEDKSVSYRDLKINANRIAEHLTQIGIRKGDKVAVMMFNGPEIIYTWFATALIGAIFVPLNTALKGEILKYQIDDSDSKIIFLDSRLLQFFNPIREYLKKNIYLVVFDKSQKYEVNGKFTSFEEVTKKGELRDSVEVLPEDIASILYTSGTTGPPKGVVLAHRAYVESAFRVSRSAQLREKDIFYNTLPLFHTSGQTVSTLPTLFNDLKIIHEEWFHASVFWQNIKRCEATITFLLSSMITILLKRDAVPEGKTHNLRVVFTGAMPKNQMNEFENKFNLKTLECYAMTETCGGVVLSNPIEAIKIGSIGIPVEGFEAKVVNEYDQDLQSNKIGELLIRPTKPFSMLLEYYKKHDKTVESFRNFWFHTGDYVYQDDEGYFYFVERKKDIIRRRGENIAPFSIEMVANTHPKILESIAVGVPSEMGEEEVKLCVTLLPDSKLDPVDFLRWCDENLPYYMVPRYIEILEEIPKTANQKAQRYLLKQRGVSNAFDRETIGFKPKRPT